MTEMLIFMLVGMALLYAGGESLIRGGVAMALRMGVTPLVVGLTVISFGTSAPELGVSVNAAWHHNSAIALGNVIGSNICNIGLVLGLASLIRPLNVQVQIIRREVPIMLVATVVIILMLWNGWLGRVEGGFLVAALLAYTFYSIRDSRMDQAQSLAKEVGEVVGSKVRPAWVSIALVLGGLALLVAGSHIFVRGAVMAAEHLGLSPFVIGLTIVAIGTSLPEIATSAVAAFRDEADLAIGNVIGSNIFNIFCILGVTALFFTIDGDGLSRVDMGVMLAFSVVILPVLRNGFIIKRWEGAGLLLAYIAYLAWLIRQGPSA